MPAVAAVLVVAVACWGGWLVLRMVRAAHWVRRRVCAGTGVTAGAPRFVFVVPALREVETLPPLVDHLLTVDREVDALVVVVTSEREHDEHRLARARLDKIAAACADPVDPDAFARRVSGLFPSGAARALAVQLATALPAERTALLTRRYDELPTTPSVAAELVRTRHTRGGRELLHLHYPDVVGGKSEQLNFVLTEIVRRLESDGTAPDDVYFVVYDADSQPDLRAAAYVARECVELRRRGSPLPALFQQVPLPLRRPASARSGLADRLVRMYALWHVRRGLAVEIDRLLRYGRIRRTRPGSLLRTARQPLVYAVGAGMFLHLPALLAIGGFPSAVDDIGLGHRYTLRDLDMRPVPYFTAVDRYSSIGALARAHALVLWGSVNLPPVVPDSRLPRTAQRVLLLREVLDTLWWVVGPLVVVLASAILVVWSPAVALSLIVATVLWQYTLPLVLSAVTLRRLGLPDWRGLDGLSMRDVALCCLLSPALPVLHWVGPVRGGWRLLGAAVRRRRPRFGKTER